MEIYTKKVLETIKQHKQFNEFLDLEKNKDGIVESVNAP